MGTSALRKGRWSQPGNYYFLTAVTAGRQRIFDLEAAAMIALGALRSSRHGAAFRTDAAVIMPDHIHFCGELLAGTLAQLMRSYKGYTSRMICRTAAIAPPVWQAGYHDHGLRSDQDHLSRVRYLLDNPVRAGLCHSLEGYPYWFSVFHS